MLDYQYLVEDLKFVMQLFYFLINGGKFLHICFLSIFCIKLLRTLTVKIRSMLLLHSFSGYERQILQVISHYRNRLECLHGILKFILEGIEPLCQWEKSSEMKFSSKSTTGNWKELPAAGPGTTWLLHGPAFQQRANFPGTPPLIHSGRTVTESDI